MYPVYGGLSGGRTASCFAIPGENSDTRAVQTALFNAACQNSYAITARAIRLAITDLTHHRDILEPECEFATRFQRRGQSTWRPDRDTSSTSTISPSRAEESTRVSVPAPSDEIRGSLRRSRFVETL